MIRINPKEISPVKLQGYLQSSVGPRPIAFASTMDKNRTPNLSPFSFFNVFSSNPPILVFSPARRVRDNTIKHTLINCEATREVVINVVNYDIVQQMSLSSTEYPDGVNEFLKSGLTMLPSEIVKPFRVAESPVQFECKVNDIISLGTEGGAGNLIICEVVQMHISEDILDANGMIDQHKIDLVSRMGANWYSRSNQGLFEIPKPLATMGIGVDQIPDEIRNSPILTGTNLGRLGNVMELPSAADLEEFAKSDEIQEMRIRFKNDKDSWLDHLHLRAKEELETGDAARAWKYLLQKQ